MNLNDVIEPLRKKGYVERDPKENKKVFYEFGLQNFMVSDIAKKLEFTYKDGVVEEVVLTQYWFGSTTFKTIATIEELLNNI